MVETNESDGPKGLKPKAVKDFPGAFRGKTNANLAKASDWWKKKDLILKEDPCNTRYMTPSQLGLWRKSSLKAAPGRGPKRAPWVDLLNYELLEEFDRLRRAGVKCDSKMLIPLAQQILASSENAIGADYVDPKDGKPVIDKINCAWICRFTERFNIVVRMQTGKSR